MQYNKNYNEIVNIIHKYILMLYQNTIFKDILNSGCIFVVRKSIILDSMLPPSFYSNSGGKEEN